MPFYVIPSNALTLGRSYSLLVLVVSFSSLTRISRENNKSSAKRMLEEKKNNKQIWLCRMYCTATLDLHAAKKNGALKSYIYICKSWIMNSINDCVMIQCILLPFNCPSLTEGNNATMIMAPVIARIIAHCYQSQGTRAIIIMISSNHKNIRHDWQNTVAQCIRLSYAMPMNESISGCSTHVCDKQRWSGVLC